MARLSLALFLLLSSTAFGQQATKWEPTSPPRLDLSRVAIAKATQGTDGFEIALIIPKWAMEERTREVQVTTYVTETRTRTVRTPNGDVEQTYNVQVPVTELRTETYTVMVPLGTDRISVPASQTKAWNVMGELLSEAQLLGRLRGAGHVMLLDSGEKPDISPYYASILNPTLVFLYDGRPPAPVPLPQADPFGAPGGDSLDDPFAPSPPAPVPPPAPEVDPFG